MWSRATAVGHLDASLERMFGYHMGWWGERGDPCPEAAEGKALRPTLAFLGADAADVPTATAEPGAVAVAGRLVVGDAGEVPP